ncbi:MAG: GTPase [Promethearchaeota archaeon]
MTKKILLLGRASTGKTSIISAILEGKDPLLLMMNPLDPTRGIETSVHNWMDITLSIFDTSGQEINNYIDKDEEQQKVFQGAELVIYIFDYPSWINNPIDLIEEIRKIELLIQKKYIRAELILILHKIDLIHSQQKLNLFSIKNDILELIEINDTIQLYFTSIYPELISETFNVFFDIFSRFSEDTKNLKKILDAHSQKLSKTMYMVTDDKNHLIAQSKSADFKIQYIRKLQKLLKPIDDKTNEISTLYERLFFIDEETKIFSVLISKIHSSNQAFRNLISITEIQNSNYLEENKEKLMKNIISSFSF